MKQRCTARQSAAEAEAVLLGLGSELDSTAEKAAARAVGKRAAAATEPTGGGSHRLKASTRGVCVVFGQMV